MEFFYVLPSGRTAIRNYALDGSDTVNAELDGTPATDRASMKGQKLIIQSTIEATAGALKSTPVRSMATWVLSSDLKTLTVQKHYELKGKGKLLGDTETSIYVRQ